MVTLEWIDMDMEHRVSDMTPDLDQNGCDFHIVDQSQQKSNQRITYYDPVRDCSFPADSMYILLDKIHFIYTDDTGLSSVSPPSNLRSIESAVGSRPKRSSTQSSRRSSRCNTVNCNDTRADSHDVADDEMEQFSDSNDEPVLLRHPATRPACRPDYTVPGGQERLPSRSSGVVLANSKGPYLNKAPQLAPQRPVTEASLLKRGLTKLGEATMSRRASGANDPENITIVNLVDNHGKKWSEVAEILNGARIAKGLQPSFTANGVHNRYNRNAPLLTAAEGREFIPVRERNSKAPNSATSPAWTPELDKLLVEIIQIVDAEKWPRVALLFNQASGMDVTAETVAYRNSLI